MNRLQKYGTTLCSIKNREFRSKDFFRRWYGAEEFINNKKKYCLWLSNCSPSQLQSMPNCLQRVKMVSEYRRNSKSPGTQKLADTPLRFHVENFPESDYLVIPEVSSENRKYIPIGFMKPDVLCSNKLRLATGVSLYHFGILTSKMHMCWVNYVCGRLESRYDYSIRIVYNNYPWPQPSQEQIISIERAAQTVLDIRSNHPGDSFATLYDPLTMPEDLLKAHQKLDLEVDKAYNPKGFKNDDERIKFLFNMYNNAVNN